MGNQGGKNACIRATNHLDKQTDMSYNVLVGVRSINLKSKEPYYASKPGRLQTNRRR